jgi:hypothetical protein
MKSETKNIYFVVFSVILMTIVGIVSAINMSESIISNREYKNNKLQEQYQAWTNYNKRTDVTFFEFIQLKDIGVLK